MFAASLSDSCGNNPITKLPPINKRIERTLVSDETKKRVKEKLAPSLYNLQSKKNQTNASITFNGKAKKDKAKFPVTSCRIMANKK